MVRLLAKMPGFRTKGVVLHGWSGPICGSKELGIRRQEMPYDVLASGWEPLTPVFGCPLAWAVAKQALLQHAVILWMDKIHIAPPKKPWHDDSPVNTNKRFPMDSIGAGFFFPPTHRSRRNPAGPPGL